MKLQCALYSFAYENISIIIILRTTQQNYYSHSWSQKNWFIQTYFLRFPYITRQKKRYFLEDFNASLFLHNGMTLHIRRCENAQLIARLLFPSFLRSRDKTVNSFRSRRRSQQWQRPNTSTSIAARARPAEKLITPLSVYTGSRLHARPRNVFPLRPRMQRETCSYRPAVQRSVGLWGEIAEVTAGCGRSSIVYGVIVQLEFF